ncbi:heat shock protein 70-like protein-like protein [Delitschia confertaspora ATCC 74209]|uniref:Heat shock protein 70-like protein-like protein n=1 Tax=Delitschia confertaspora ATCC 74209 TaxID=1513339 RepID=A0A9P4JSI9_9PLEO|nr:heat shock protein 70-like protein-like protein [Delitschia confertaspora ATCC 74209]
MAPPGRRRGTTSPLSILLGLFLLFSSTASAASAVLGIDLGTEYIKAALIKPGIPLEIVLTKDSKRKEVSAVAFKPSKSGALPAGSFPERFYGSDAVALAARFPGDVYPNLKALLGIPSENDAVKVYTERYPALETASLENRNTVSFKSNTLAEGEKPFSVEELLAMELKNIRENAKALAGKGVSIEDAVITVPPFYTVNERRALEVAARLAGLKLLGVVSDGLAVGLNYATSRTFPNVAEGGKPEVHLVFDMGAGSTSATVLKFQGKTVKDVGRFNKTIQEVSVLGTGWDRTLGGDSLNSLIVEDMISSFVATPSAKSASLSADKVKSHGRAAAKLWKEAEKVRQVLSANTATSAFFESFIDDVDFRYKIERPKFEEMATDFAMRVNGPVEQALAAAGLTIKDIDTVILHGGAVRTPFVQRALESIAGASKLKSNVNSDEAAVFGAAFKAAGLSPSFRVKEIRDIDIQGYAFGIQYMFNLKERDQKIFTPTSKIGGTKDIPFQMMGEFEFTTYQTVPSGGAELVKAPVLHFRSGNLTRQITNMIDNDKCDRETFNNYVQVRLSPVTGLPEVTAAWVTCETEESEKKGGVMDNVKGFFGMGGKKDQEPLKEGESSSEAATSGTSDPSSSTSVSSASSTSASAEASEAATSGSKKKTVKSAITYHVTQKGYEKHPRKEFKRMIDRLAAFDASDKARRTREEILNNLEAFTYRARDYLEDEAFIASSTSQERSSLEQKLSASSDWIYEVGHDATEDVLKSKLKELNDIVDPIQKRKDEAAKRPDAVKGLQDALDQLKQVGTMVKEQIKSATEASAKAAEESSKSASESASSSSTAAAASGTTEADPLVELEDDNLKGDSDASADAPEPSKAPEIPAPLYTDEDLKQLTDAEEASRKWLEEKLAAQEKLKESDDPVITVKDLQDQTTKLNNVLMDMMMKKMRAPPKPKSKPKPKPKKPKKSKKASKDAEKPEERSETEKSQKDTEAEIKEALEKAGIKGDSVKLDFGHKNEIKDKDGRPLIKLDINKDATEEEITEAIKKATEDVRGAEQERDEL